MNNIVLIGFMASGKSTIGRALAKKIDKFFIDTDTLIEMNEGLSIPDIFKTHGVEYFRNIEKHIAPKLAESFQSCVISTGGGYVTSANPREFGTVFYLECGFETIKKRIAAHDHPRPLFKNEEQAKALYRERLPLYEKYADYTINTSDSLENIINFIYTRI